MSIYPPKDIRPGQAAGPDLQFWNLCSLHHHKAPFSWHTQGSVGELSVKLCDLLSPRPEYQGDYLRHLLRFYFFLRWWSMKRSYPCVQENNEPCSHLHALAGSHKHAGDVCHTVAPPGAGCSSACHPPQRMGLGQEGCWVTAYVLGLIRRNSATQQLPGS